MVTHVKTWEKCFGHRLGLRISQAYGNLNDYAACGPGVKAWKCMITSNPSPLFCVKIRGIPAIPPGKKEGVRFSSPKTATGATPRPKGRRANGFSGCRGALHGCRPGGARPQINQPQFSNDSKFGAWGLQKWSDSPHFTQGDSAPMNSLGLINRGST